MVQADSKKVNINKEIRANKVLLIGEDGKNLGVISLNDALYRAYNLGMDLVEVGNKDNVPVCKIIDYGKWKYEQEKKKKGVQFKQQTKEINFRPNTGNNDLTYRAKQVDDFLEEGHKVKLTVKFKGREQEHMLDTGRKLLERFLNMISVKFSICSTPSIDGKTISMTLIGENK